MVTALTQTVSIYVPSTIKGSIKAPKKLVDSVLKDVMGRMIDLNGGCTVFSTIGAYKLANGKIVTEQIAIVRSSSETIDESAVFAIAEDVCRIMSQECVSVDINGALYFVSETKLKVAI